MKKTINISTGEVKKGTFDKILYSSGIGSCIVLAAINLKKDVGAIAYIMLPGKAPLNENQNKTKYAEDAVDKMLHLLQVDIDDTFYVRTCLVGAGNVLKKQDDTICKNNIHSLLSILNSRKIKIDAHALGGTNRRSVRFDVENREVYITNGDSKESLLKRW